MRKREGDTLPATLPTLVKERGGCPHSVIEGHGGVRTSTVLPQLIVTEATTKFLGMSPC